MVRQLIMLSALFSLLTGCLKNSEKAPTGPGVSLPLRYPVLLASDRNLVVKDDEQSLITKTEASGLNFPEYRIIDSAGMQYKILKETPFGKKSAWLDMGTSHFQVFLELKPQGKIDLPKARQFVLGVALDKGGIVAETEKGPAIATQRIQGAKSFAELMDVCRKTWEWR